MSGEYYDIKMNQQLQVFQEETALKAVNQIGVSTYYGKIRKMPQK
jgi:hypothetical protein